MSREPLHGETTMKTFPFGKPILQVRQTDRSPKKVFVLGVYASAVHARWVRPDGSTAIRALAVASEPEIFWPGDHEDEIIESIPIPKAAGRLVAPENGLNGPSGRSLDQDFLRPMGLTRTSAWLCDLLPESRCNPNQAAAIQREYESAKAVFSLPDVDFPPVPEVLADGERVKEIESELIEAESQVLVTLGDLPLKWFARHYGAKSQLSAYGTSLEQYGQMHAITVGGRRVFLVPLVHPRQASRLGGHSSDWAQLHQDWIAKTAPGILASVPA